MTNYWKIASAVLVVLIIGEVIALTIQAEEKKNNVYNFGNVNITQSEFEKVAKEVGNNSKNVEFMLCQLNHEDVKNSTCVIVNSLRP